MLAALVKAMATHTMKIKAKAQNHVSDGRVQRLSPAVWDVVQANKVFSDV